MRIEDRIPYKRWTLKHKTRHKKTASPHKTKLQNVDASPLSSLINHPCFPTSPKTRQQPGCPKTPASSGASGASLLRELAPIRPLKSPCPPGKTLRQVRPAYVQVRKPVIVISSARVAEEALKHNDLTFSSRPSFICTRKLSYNNRDIADSPYTEYWREMRKIVVLRLFTLKQVNSFRPVRKDEVARMVKEISRRANAHQPVNINETTLSLSSSMISRFALGKRYDEEDGSEKMRFDRLLKQMQELTLQIFIGDYFPWLGWIDKLCGRVSRLEKGFKDFDSFYEELIEEHLSPHRPESMNGDILDLLIQLREDRSSSVQIDWDHIKGVLMTGSGSEILLTLGHACKIGVFSAEPFGILRLLAFTFILCHYRLNYLQLNKKDPNSWQNPDEFLPERFLNTGVDFKGQDFGFLPFGTGRRVCPGIALGIAEVEVALANLLYSFDWELPTEWWKMMLIWIPHLE
ncbi:UNVERIFIED_CONTAM: cytochrome [Sesamum calycinum]|uniref:Cytochrome n=1 Tax=Sesamum calycinum TaxID=2727403 RepID=A0AAW2RAC3_9LAMI